MSSKNVNACTSKLERMMTGFLSLSECCVVWICDPGGSAY